MSSRLFAQLPTLKVNRLPKVIMADRSDVFAKLGQRNQLWGYGISPTRP